MRIEPQDSGLPKTARAQAEQVRSIDVRRLRQRIGQLGDSTMHAIDEALKLHPSL